MKRDAAALGRSPRGLHRSQEEEEIYQPAEGDRPRLKESTKFIEFNYKRTVIDKIVSFSK